MRKERDELRVHLEHALRERDDMAGALQRANDRAEVRDLREENERLKQRVHRLTQAVRGLADAGDADSLREVVRHLSWVL